MYSTYLSFYLNANRIHVFIEALRGIGSPSRVCFMIDRDAKRLLMLPHAKKDLISHKVPQKIYSGAYSMEICSKKLCHISAISEPDAIVLNAYFWTAAFAKNAYFRTVDDPGTGSKG